MPALASRIEDLTPKNARAMPQGMEHELKKLYYDISTVISAPSMAALMKMATPSQVVFGSDFTGAMYGDAKLKTVIDEFTKLGLGSGEQTAIARGNIERIVPRLKRLYASK